MVGGVTLLRPCRGGMTTRERPPTGRAPLARGYDPRPLRGRRASSLTTNCPLPLIQVLRSWSLVRSLLQHHSRRRFNTSSGMGVPHSGQVPLTFLVRS